MAHIKIIAPPPGQAPEWVRKSWVGLEFEAKPSGNGVAMGVLGGKAQNSGGFEVLTETALEALMEKNEEAAMWFYDNSIVTPDSSLVFARRVCEVMD